MDNSTPDSPIIFFNLLQRLLNPVPDSEDIFARSVALSGNNVLISSFFDNDTIDDDTLTAVDDVAYLFDGATGTLLQTFLNPTPPTDRPLADQFGFAVALDGNNALISAPLANENGSNSGAAYLFNTTTGSLIQTFLNPVPTGDDEFGHSLAIDEETVLIGTPFSDREAPNSGAAYLFDGATGDLLQTFLNPTPEGGDLFGDVVALDNDKVLIGAFLDNEGATNSGATHLFDAVTGNLLRTFVNPTPANGDLFGRAVAMEGDRALISAPFDGDDTTQRGTVYLFDTVTGEILQTFQNPSASAGEAFGLSVALSSDNVLIGANLNDGGGENSGAAYLFDATTGKHLQTFLNPTPDEGDLFGNTVALEQNNLLVGAIGDNDGGDNSGAVYLFQQFQPPLSDLIHVSFNGSGSIGDLSFKDDDILTFNRQTADWSIYLDGSDIGLRNSDIDAFDLLPDGSIVFSLTTAATLFDVGAVTSADLVRFIPTSTGSNTAGRFELYLKGTDVGLDTSNENIDALDVLPDGQIVISTTGAIQVDDILGTDADVLILNPASLGTATSGRWTLHLDGSDIGLTSSSEDINGVWMDESHDIALTTRGTFDISSLQGDGDDIFRFISSSLGTKTRGAVSSLWEEAIVGLEDNVVDGFAIVTGDSTSFR
ncbi:MAG: hypothetical protein AAF572_21775 [Cyanobacteria bacterium P01_B01_bin.77]